MAMEPKSKFTNVLGGVAGAIQLDHEDKAKGVPVYPGDSIWLTEQEQVLTANAPRNEEDNPFANGTFRLEIKSEDATNARPIGDNLELATEPPPPEPDPEDPEEIDLRQEQAGAADPPAETGAPPTPEGEPPAGQVAQHEEVADVVVEPAPPSPEPGAEEKPPPAKPQPMPLPKPPATD